VIPKGYRWLVIGSSCDISAGGVYYRYRNSECINRRLEVKDGDVSTVIAAAAAVISVFIAFRAIKVAIRQLNHAMSLKQMPNRRMTLFLNLVEKDMENLRFE